ncbi:unnamed protein product [Rhizoctonia solani]|uniref:Uncharacterized protein n=1 Tax=Rhizoctonia solani TaxID=456999 RepID=A0A8H3HHV6_9AGAM|nr:unnamed protein product [Rhizoctonia solani]CAE6514506.1 unnamed protein product [Rhizoctonia solani]
MSANGQLKRHHACHECRTKKLVSNACVHAFAQDADSEFPRYSRNAVGAGPFVTGVNESKITMLLAVPADPYQSVHTISLRAKKCGFIGIQAVRNGSIFKAAIDLDSSRIDHW